MIPIDEVVHVPDINTHDATGAVTDADSTPTYAVYEEDNDTPIVTGNFTKRTSLTGEYRASFTASAGNGFEAGKCYSVKAFATVDGISAKATIMWFRVAPAEPSAGVPSVVASSLGTQAKADVNAEVLDVLNTDTFAEPGQEAPPATASIVRKLGWLYKSFRNRKTQDATTLKIFADNGTTVDAKATVSDSGTEFDHGEIQSGP
jgi:hypothetical protein